MAVDLAANENRKLSPLTGLTREHWANVARDLMAAVVPYIDRETGRVTLPEITEPGLAAAHRNPGGDTEAFERTLILAAMLVAGSGDSRLGDVDLGDLYRRGIETHLDTGTPPKDLRRVGIGTSLAMLIAPEVFLDPLADSVKTLLAEHLALFVERRTSQSNTMLFSMMPAPLLERLGAKYNRPLLDDYFDQILSQYRGDGWFIDGWNRGFDHYNFWGFQFYLHALMHFDTRWREQYAERIREITAAHEQTLPCYFGRDGGPIPKGRSMNYRFAGLSGIGTSHLSGLASMNPGLARRIASGCLRYFWEHGCRGDRGLLEPGYHGPNAALGEDYTDRGAPYWAATGLSPLLLPADHPFWAAEEQPMPADSPGVTRCAIPGAEMVLKVDGDRGEARMITGGEPFLHRATWQAGAKYYQHATSSAIGYALVGEGGPELAAGRTGISTDGQTWAYRTWPRCRRIDPWRVRSEWDAWAGREGITGCVVTETLILDHGEVHIFWHTADEPRYLTIGGYAIRLEHGERPMMDLTGDGLAVAGDEMWSILTGLRTLPGRFAMEEVHPREGFEHAHLFGGWSAFPRWTSGAPVPPETKLVFFVDAARRGEAPDIETPEITVDENQATLRITADGRTFEV
jgi:hypothetical protein